MHYIVSLKCSSYYFCFEIVGSKSLQSCVTSTASNWHNLLVPIFILFRFVLIVPFKNLKNLNFNPLVFLGYNIKD